jgi:hypothetical protein
MTFRSFYPMVLPTKNNNKCSVSFYDALFRDELLKILQMARHISGPATSYPIVTLVIKIKIETETTVVVLQKLKTVVVRTSFLSSVTQFSKI